VVLDAGCGSGRVTAELMRRVPRGRVYGVDVAPSMVAHAREHLGEAATVLCQDLLELKLPEQVDLAFSNATFHWIDDHDALFAVLLDALRPGGRLVAQCGGAGNVEAFMRAASSVACEEPFARYFEGWRFPGRFVGADETAARLRDAGFADVSCWLERKSVTPADPRRFVQTVCLVRHLDALPTDARGPFVARVLERIGEPMTLEYVRLNMVASRP
jgi:trans-aconitate 2-methyltransferase